MLLTLLLVSDLNYSTYSWWPQLVLKAYSAYSAQISDSESLGMRLCSRSSPALGSRPGPSHPRQRRTPIPSQGEPCSPLRVRCAATAVAPARQPGREGVRAAVLQLVAGIKKL